MAATAQVLCGLLQVDSQVSEKSKPFFFFFSLCPMDEYCFLFRFVYWTAGALKRAKTFVPPLCSMNENSFLPLDLFI